MGPSINRHPFRARHSTRAASSLLVLAALTVFGCGATGVGNSPGSVPLQSAEPSLAVEVSDEEISAGVATRKLYGLRADPEWVRAVAADPAAQAGIIQFGIPLTPAEQSDIQGRRWDENLLRQAQAYCTSVAEDCSGAYINLKGSGVIVDIAHNIDRHKQTLRNLVADPNLVEVHGVQWSAAELDNFKQQVTADRAWFDTIGVEMMQVDRSINDNFIHVDYMAPTDAASQAIEGHFGNPSWLRAEWVGPAPWVGPRADLRIKIRDTKNRPGVGIRCDIQPANAAEGVDLGEVVFATDDDGVCRAEGIPAVAYRVRLFRSLDGHEERIKIPELRVILPATGREVTVRIPAS